MNNNYSPSNTDTPASTASSGTKVDISPVILKYSESVADVAGNWRVRAKENGIKVDNADDSKGDVFDLRSTY